LMNCFCISLVWALRPPALWVIFSWKSKLVMFLYLFLSSFLPLHDF
jgi:hypothetical protein